MIFCMQQLSLVSWARESDYGARQPWCSTVYIQECKNVFSEHRKTLFSEHSKIQWTLNSMNTKVHEPGSFSVKKLSSLSHFARILQCLYLVFMLSFSLRVSPVSLLFATRTYKIPLNNSYKTPNSCQLVMNCVCIWNQFCYLSMPLCIILDIRIRKKSGSKTKS